MIVEKTKARFGVTVLECFLEGRDSVKIIEKHFFFTLNADTRLLEALSIKMLLLLIFFPFH